MLHFVRKFPPENFNNWLEYKCGERFPCGSNNISVDGIWGSYTNLPAGLQEAIISLVLERVQPGITGIESSQGAISKVDWDDVSIDFNVQDVDMTIPSTGFLYIDRLIQAYIPTNSQIKFAVAERQCTSDCCTSNNKDCNRCK